MAPYAINFTGSLNQEIAVSSSSSNSNSTTTDTILQSINIGPSVFTNGDCILLSSIFERTNNNGNIVGRFHINTGNTLTGAIQIGTRTLTAANNIILLERRLYIANETGGGAGNSIGTQVISTATNLTDDFRAGLTSTLTIDWTQDIWLIASGFIAVAPDVITCYGLKAFKY